MELATACDLRVVDPETTFGLPEMDLGSLPGSGGIQRLASLVGRGRTLEWVLTSRRFDASEAHASGLATEITAPHNAQQRALELAKHLAKRPPMPVEVVKALLDPSTVRSGSMDETIHAIAAANVRYSGAIKKD